MVFGEAFVKAMKLPGYEEPSGEDILAICAGCQWVEAQTAYRFDDGEVDAGVKLFLVKFRELLDSGAASGILSERLAGMSQAGMSQTFSQGAGLEELVQQMAAQLLAAWYKPVVFVPAESRFM